MAIVEINIVPLGTSAPSVGQYIADAIGILEECRLKYELTSMGTIIEGELDEILALAKKMHETPFLKGIKRVVTTIRIDDRRDEKATSSGKIKSVTDKLRNGRALPRNKFYEAASSAPPIVPIGPKCSSLAMSEPRLTDSPEYCNT